MMITFYERKRNVGLVAGGLIMVTFPFSFAAWSLVQARTLVAILLLGAMAVVALGLVVSCLGAMRRVRRLPHLRVGNPVVGRSIAIRYWSIVAMEYVAITLVARWCGSHHHWKWIAPLIEIIVGIHFLPLARLFKAPLYNVPAVLFCVIPIVTMLSMPSSAYVGHAPGWVVVPPVGCALVGFWTAWAGLNEVRRFLGGIGLEVHAGTSTA